MKIYEDFSDVPYPISFIVFIFCIIIYSLFFQIFGIKVNNWIIELFNWIIVFIMFFLAEKLICYLHNKYNIFNL